MKSKEVCELLGVNRVGLAQLVRQGFIRIVSSNKGAKGFEYNDRDVLVLYERRHRHGRIKGPKSIVTVEVQEAAASLKMALDKALSESGLSRDEAAGRLSRFISELWEECEAMTDRLPGKLRAA